MKTSPNETGDFGEYIIAELSERGVVLAKPPTLPGLFATWRTIRVEIEGASKAAGGAIVEGCSLENLMFFFSSLLSSFRVNRPFSKDNEKNFWFEINAKRGNFTRDDEGAVITFLTEGVSLTIAYDEDYASIFIGFSKCSTVSGGPAQNV